MRAWFDFANSFSYEIFQLSLYFKKRNLSIVILLQTTQKIDVQHVVCSMCLTSRSLSNFKSQNRNADIISHTYYLLQSQVGQSELSLSLMPGDSQGFGQRRWGQLVKTSTTSCNCTSISIPGRQRINICHSKIPAL